MGVKMADIERAIAEGNKVLQQLRRVCPAPGELPPPAPSKNRIRQSSKPLSNRAESEFGIRLRNEFPSDAIYEQAITFRLANGVRYTPDWVRFSETFPHCYEVKGKHSWDDAIVKLKVAANLYRHFSWWICFKSPQGEWQMKLVFS